MSILVTGGAGYIGSVIVEQLLKQNEEVVVLDNLTQGHRRAISDEALFIEGDIGDRELVEDVLDKHEVEAVIHMAAETVVERSMTDPKGFFRENVVKGISLLDAMLEHNVGKLIFSSSAAVYGEPQEGLITEDHRKEPLNAYGESKYMFERVLAWYHRAYGLKYIALRYFNAAGASERFGEDHDPESHLIPLVLRRALAEQGSGGDRKNYELRIENGEWKSARRGRARKAEDLGGNGTGETGRIMNGELRIENGKEQEDGEDGKQRGGAGEMGGKENEIGQIDLLRIFGNDYSTRDGTCVRDYIHVVDLAQAHILALKSLNQHSGARYNLGNGEGFTVLEVIGTAKRVTGVGIPYEFAPRRSGDPAVLVASPERAKRELGWEPKFTELEAIVESAWRWHKSHPEGYE